jgi:predicted metal-dependent hydrolase
MSTRSFVLQVGSIEALVIRKQIKNLHLSVLPPNGKVRVAAPLVMKDDAIITLLATRLSWIKKQQTKFAEQDRQTKREYVSGETHYFLGRPYQMTVKYENSPANVELKGKNMIVLHVRPDSALEKREQVMVAWYRKELRLIGDDLLAKWQQKIGVQMQFWGIKRMKTRWGTCDEDTGRIWLNLELVKKPVSCIEYVVVHELLHLIERKHNEHFVNLITKYLPKWRHEKEELNRSMLSYEEWDY